MELATNYMSLLQSKPGFADKLSRVAKPSFWEECLDQMTSPIYAVDGDEHRISAAAIERTGQSLHVKVCCAELFLALLSRELKGFVRKQYESDTESLCAKPIVKHILGHRRGAKEALEKSFKACTKLWSMYGLLFYVIFQISRLQWTQMTARRMYLSTFFVRRLAVLWR
jgi:hypothetical protein